ncbi:hypothetical protein K9M42_02090 [Patescibacteria group bacterium]|nr:hypothetical protein [Patescibacteria group bacterium]
MFIIVFDFIRVNKKTKRPLFVIEKITQDDGGSGLYKGLGYSVDIEGNFMPEDEHPGITRSDYELFGIYKNTVYVEYD